MAAKKNEIPDDDSGNPFKSLRSLLSLPTRTVSVATLATAIETEGIYAFDRFGRFTKCDKSTPEAKVGLNDKWCNEFEEDRAIIVPAEHHLTH